LVQFAKLRLAGFKSFVEPSELIIEPGLTGVVGPNGCGKSNLVDALRWVMAETSAKEMRGGEMDDVIFGGTADRPARNIAEVSIVLDNSDRNAPAAYNGDEAIEITRRIERSEGSHYRVNGRDVRARDVALLFADVASGARSTAIVSQGRVGSLVAARPIDRRALLEEAAGITGLHNRRHEAELRLRAAETNLQRLDDVLVTLDTQLDGLKKQARQATRYRNLSDHIRRAEAILLYRRWRDAQAAVEAARLRFSEIDARVADLTGAAAAAATAQADTAARLAPLRQAEAIAAAELHRLAVALDGLDAEEARVQAAQAELMSRLDQIEADKTRERTLELDTTAARERLGAERSDLAAAQIDEAEHERGARDEVQAATANAEAVESRLTALTAEIAATEARRAELAQRRSDSQERIERLSSLLDDIAKEMAAIRQAAVAEHDLAGAAAAREQARIDLETAQSRAGEADAARARAEETERSARETLHEIEGSVANLRAEERALAKLLTAGESDMWPPIIDRVTVAAGYEATLGAALGDDLGAPADEGAPVHWRSLLPFAVPATLPDGVVPLSNHVRAPETLARRLSQIGFVETAAEGATRAAELKPGQRLVSRDGALWRWDGFTIRAGAVTTAAMRLAQRNRLAALRPALESAARDLADVQARYNLARETSQTAMQAARDAQERARHCLSALDQAREGHGALAQRSAADASRLSMLEDAVARSERERAEAESKLAEAERGLASLSQSVSSQAQLERLRVDLAERRASLAERQSRLDRFIREAEVRRHRLDDIAKEDDFWRERSEAAARQLKSLDERAIAAQSEQARLAERPGEIALQRNALSDRITIAEAKRKAASDELVMAETHLADADRRLKSAEQALAEAREERVRSEAAVEQAELTSTNIAERIAERLDCTPDQALDVAGIKDEAELPDLAHLEGRLDRLHRERDNMGAVNLRAEQEATELNDKIVALRSERDDLLAAIARLRDGIAELNREGRQRLLASFETVNEHFQVLFTRLFGGGRARLMLTDLDNPLEAGLEIMASPPGKRLQVLSLLSGGERALTALALLFAVFMANPAPICILDEVDAPLDDANVDRICSLLEEIAHHSSTRFLVITHHRMTMARMDRLFGVTMPEAGVSQLVSVDLARAERLRATA
jgi:chromosome segregation protein